MLLEVSFPCSSSYIFLVLKRDISRYSDMYDSQKFAYYIWFSQVVQMKSCHHVPCFTESFIFKRIKYLCLSLAFTIIVSCFLFIIYSNWKQISIKKLVHVSCKKNWSFQDFIFCWLYARSTSGIRLYFVTRFLLICYWRYLKLLLSSVLSFDISSFQFAPDISKNKGSIF